MLKPKELIARLEAWEKLKKQRDRIDANADGQIEDLLSTYERKAEPINTERERKLEPVVSQMEMIESEIREAMLRQIKPDGTIGLPQLETEHALAQVLIDKRREIDAAAFIRATPPRRRNDPAFYGCLTVQIGKAEKFCDQPTMTRLTRLKLTPSVCLKLKND